MKKTLLYFSILIFSSFAAFGVDWTTTRSEGSGIYISSPEANAAPKSAAIGINLASTEFRYEDSSFNDFIYSEDFKDSQQIAVASVMGLSYSDIAASGTTVSIQVDCPQGFYLVSESNPAYRRPFNIILAVSYARIQPDGSYAEIRERIGYRLSRTGQSMVLDVSQPALSSRYNGQEFRVMFDILLELPGEISNGILTIDNTTYPIANLYDYTSVVSINISSERNSGMIISDTITIPFSGYYDSRTGSGEGNVASLALNPTARASTVNLLEDQGQPLDVASINFLRLLDDQRESFDNVSTRVFMSSSANPDVSGGKFMFVHDSLAGGDILDDRNSISYEVRVTDNDGSDMTIFDGTMIAADLSVFSEDKTKVIIPHNLERRTQANYGSDFAKWQEYDGTVSIILENKYNTMYSGAYHSYIYVHVFVEDNP